jgi:hypothetical protein
MPPYCIFQGCTKIKLYNYEGETKGIYCTNHKLENMVVVTNTKCAYDNCKKSRLYNYEGETKGIYCTNHKLENMVDVMNKRCDISGCSNKACYSFKNIKKAKYCNKHKLENMVNVTKTLCYDIECDKIALYNFQGNKKGKYCNDHKLDGMIYVSKKKSCKYENCTKSPCYNYENLKSGKYCSEHKLEGMVVVTGPKCKYEGCTKTPGYNYENLRSGKYCSEHKLEGMVVVSGSKCKYEGCYKQPLYNHNNMNKGLYCSLHKLENMINVRDKRCKNEWCETFVSKKYDGYCTYCFVHMFPEKAISKNYKTKEKTVADYIKQQFIDIDIKTDKIIEGGCSKRRPDIFIDLGYQVLIVEIDENQHINYDSLCENKRIMQLSEDVEHRPIIFIRFNPDDYIDGNEKITSCWSINKKGVCCIKKTKEKEWYERLNKLHTTLLYWLNPKNTTNNKPIEIIKLFYNT